MEWQAQSRAPLTLPFSAIRTQEKQKKKEKKSVSGYSASIFSIYPKDRLFFLRGSKR
jgi:hypothetical protein